MVKRVKKLGGFKKLKNGNEKKALDIWSLAHICLGVLTATIFLNLQIVLYIAFIIAFIIAFLWEFPVEPLLFKSFHRRLRESLDNQLADILLNLGGFLVIWFIGSWFVGLIVFVTLSILFLIINFKIKV